ncbi:hypothetical protein MCBRY_003278 [Methylocystis bryophila]
MTHIMRRFAVSFLCVVAITSFGSSLSSSFRASAQPTDPAPSSTPAPKLSVEERALRQSWRADMLKAAPPKPGCFHSTYPNKEWREAPCRTAPNIPYPMRTDLVRADVGGGSDYVAQVAGSISTASGTFNRATNFSESGLGGANAFSLQLNTNRFVSPLCEPPSTTPATPKSPNCMGWQQFLFSNSSQGSFIQYWLIGYFDNRSTCSEAADVAHGGCCPKDWTTFKATATVSGANGCFRNSPMSSPTTPRVILTAHTLLDMNLVGRVANNTDSVVFAADTQDLYTANGLSNILSLAGNWNAVEFNIVGDGAVSPIANFTDGTKMDVWVEVDGEPTCAQPSTSQPTTGLTNESNNLTLVNGDSGPCCAWTGQGGGGISFTQSNAAGVKSICDAGDHCLPPGASCSVTGLGCCAQFGQHECKNGRCVPVVPVQSCNGVRRPTQACGGGGLGWQCCGEDGWECGPCR